MIMKCFSICIDATVDDTEDLGESRQADGKMDESDNQMTVVDDVDNNSPNGSASKQQSRSRSQSRSSYSSHKSGILTEWKVVFTISNFIDCFCPPLKSVSSWSLAIFYHCFV